MFYFASKAGRRRGEEREERRGREEERSCWRETRKDKGKREALWVFLIAVEGMAFRLAKTNSEISQLAF